MWRTPYPSSLAGWFLTSGFYILSIYIIIFSSWYAVDILSGNKKDIELKLGILIFLVVSVIFVKRSAVRSAVLTRCRAREEFDKEMARVTALKAKVYQIGA